MLLAATPLLNTLLKSLGISLACRIIGGNCHHYSCNASDVAAVPLTKSTRSIGYILVTHCSKQICRHYTKKQQDVAAVLPVQSLYPPGPPPWQAAVKVTLELLARVYRTDKMQIFDTVARELYVVAH
jgi:hypothetical protein